MEHTSFVERLMDFGLTRQEAGIYECLLREGKTTGYEVAKQLGISRSNAYNSLASMTEKGAAYLVEEGTTKKYVPVVLDEFCKNRIRHMEENKKWLCKHRPLEKEHVEGYILSLIHICLMLLSKSSMISRHSFLNLRLDGYPEDKKSMQTFFHFSCMAFTAPFSAS